MLQQPRSAAKVVFVVAVAFLFLFSGCAKKETYPWQQGGLRFSPIAHEPDYHANLTEADIAENPPLAELVEKWHDRLDPVINYPYNEGLALVEKFKARTNQSMPQDRFVPLLYEDQFFILEAWPPPHEEGEL